ncbi:MAG: DUF1801 domain-containing protein [Patescibacteria group bacterium]
MSELKTQRTNASVEEFVASVENSQRREDALKLLDVFERATGMKPVMWGTSIVGYGQYHYKSERSSQEGDWPLAGFSPRKANLTVYVLPGFEKYDDYLSRLGKHKTSVSCIYINKLSDVDTDVLQQIIKDSVAEMKRQYPSAQAT